MRKLIKNIQFILLYFALIAIKTSLMADFMPYVEGEPRLSSVKTELKNNTTSYNLWLQVAGMDLDGNGEYHNFDPVGHVWVRPGKKAEKDNVGLIPDGPGYLYFRDVTSGIKSKPKSNFIYLPSLDAGIYDLGLFIVEIKTKPVELLLKSNYIKGPDSNKEYTFTMADHFITVREKDKK